MRDILLTSSVLILALLVLRRIFWEKIPRQVQYALWGLVLVRLLIPVSLPALDFSVLTVTEPMHQTVSQRLEAPAFTAPVVPASASQQPKSSYPAAVEPTIPGTTSAVQPAAVPLDAPESPATSKTLTLTEILRIVWLAGAGIMTVWLLASNLRFAARLRKRRVSVNIPGCKYRVYMVESGLASPCLFGILRPAIYLTPSAVTSEESLRHVLAHEETHARHLDPMWSLLRGVCLAVYWFDPLVWIAASASRTDCELACDEGAVRRLGEEERLAYGRTLLSLVPICRLPGNPLLSATTMSSDKKRLRDRITRIAENRETRKLALCVLAVLTAGTFVFTFAGCAEKTADDSGPKRLNSTVERADGPITAAELRYFNEQFFNGSYMNIRNQFLSSMYDDPADIDLFELFYCGTGRYEAMTDEEWADFGSEMTDTTKVSAAAADALLTEYLGLTLDETKRVGLGNFIYSTEYDAYYYSHGDTNYRMNVAISAGVREGDLVRLYYNDTFYGDGWKCVTLRETEGGGYRFVSNAYSEKPIIPTVYPAGEPLLAIPLSDLEGYEPWTLEMQHRSNDCAERLTGYGQNWDVGGHHIQGYRATNGIIYLAEITESAVSSSDGMVAWEADCFSVMPNDAFRIELCSDLFGRNGFLTYCTDYELSGLSFLSYDAFDEDGTLLGLVTCRSEGAIDARIIDLDGDGENELLCISTSGARLFFQRDGRICEADVTALLAEALPEETVCSFDFDPYARCLSAWTSTWVEREDGVRFGATPVRNIYFDGESLLVYRQEKAAVDHVSTGVTGPEDVLDITGQIIQGTLIPYIQDVDPAQIDDWQIAGLAGPYYERFEDGMTVMLYRFAAEYHTTAPQDVVLAGGMYMDEDGWFGSGWSGYVGFILGEDDGWTANFYSPDFNPEPDAETFHEDVEQALLRASLRELTPAQNVQSILDWIMKNDTMLLSLSRPTGTGSMERKDYAISPDAGNARNRQLYFTEPYSFSWTEADGTPPAGDPAPEELTVDSPDGSFSLKFFSGSELVWCREGDSVQWYRAETMCDPADAFYDRSDIFSYMRLLFDEAECSALAARAVIPDDGRSHEEIAQAWAEAYEGSALELMETNRYHCTYVDVRDVEIDTEYPREYYPAFIGDREAFLIWYSVVFVPDDWRCHMAGNTAEYEGSDAPEGAYQYGRCAYLYRTEDGWRSDGAATGP